MRAKSNFYLVGTIKSQSRCTYQELSNRIKEFHLLRWNIISFFISYFSINFFFCYFQINFFSAIYKSLFFFFSTLHTYFCSFHIDKFLPHLNRHFHCHFFFSALYSSITHKSDTHHFSFHTKFFQHQLLSYQETCERISNSSRVKCHNFTSPRLIFVTSINYFRSYLLAGVENINFNRNIFNLNQFFSI